MVQLPGTTVQAVSVAGSRHLTAGNAAYPGQPLSLLVSSPAEPNAAYAVAASFGFRAGIPVGNGRRVNLDPDALFFSSITGTGIFTGFQGILNTRGEASFTMQIPPLKGLSGTRFFAAATTIVNGRFSVISEPVGITIE